MLSGRSLLTYTVVSFSVLFFLFSASASAQDEDMTALFEQGKDAFNRGEYDAALQAFQALLAENPSDETVFYFWEEAGHKIFLDMLIREGEFETVARRFIEKARVGRKMKEEDGSRIEALTEQIVSGDHRQRREALLELESNHGEYAVEYLYKELGNQDTEARVNVIAALSRLGEEATLPLVQVLNADDELIVQNAAVVLGRIRDGRAVPALAKLYASDETSEIVKSIAAEAIEKIAGKSADDLDDPSALFGTMAEAYVGGCPATCKPFLKSAVIWTWDGELKKVPAVPGLRSLELAEDACYAALECDAGDTKAVMLLGLVYAAQLAEIHNMEIDEDDEGANFAAESIAKANAILALCGPDRLREAFAMALEKGLFLTAIEVIDVLEEIGAFDRNSLLLAYDSGDKLVKYRAAFAAVQNGIVDDEVVWITGKALRESSIQQVLVVDDNSETRNAMLAGLNANGFFAVGASTGADGLVRAKEFPPKDLVVIRSGLEDLTIDSIIYELDSGPGSETPVLLMAANNEMEGIKGLWEGKVAGFVSDSEVASDAYLAVARDSAGDLNDARQKALALSAKAAETLASLDGSALGSVEEDLIQALDKPDEVKVPVLNALAKIGSRTALEAVAQVFGDTAASSEVRIAAAKALGAIYATGEAAPDGEVMAALQEALAGEDAGLRLAAAEAVGKSVDMESAALKEILLSNRIQ